MATDHDVIIIGAGHNGLVAAGYLARAGVDVLVLERRDLVGGACITEELWPGISAPTCSYICHMLQRTVIDDLDLRAHGMHIYPQDPHLFCPFPDGQSAVVWDADEPTTQALAQLSQHDAHNFAAFQHLRRRLARLLHRHFLEPPPTLAQLFREVDGTDDAPLLERLLVGNVMDLLDEFFESPYVKALFVRAWDAGDPTAPGSLLSTTYLWTDLFTAPEDYGVVRGGMGGITQALARSATSAGAKIKTSAEVDHVLVEEGRARGVVLIDGEEISARRVISNADPKRTFLRLLQPGHLDSDFRGRVERLRTDAAYLKFHAALDRLPDFSRYLGAEYDPRWLAYTQICPSVDYFRQSWADARSGRPSRTPLMSVQIPTVYDPSLAPDGTHVMSIWVQYAPVRPIDASWDDLRHAAGEHLIDTLATYAPDIRQCIREWMLLTPPDIEQRVGLTDGNIRHIDMVLGQMLADRPLAGWSDYRTPIRDLYLCGAGTHPGGEVTGAPGHNAAHAVLHDLQAAG
jgi:phytoene dehydrogenase-like protein